jgi:uncharacterized membrane protein YfcA
MSLAMLVALGVGAGAGAGFLAGLVGIGGGVVVVPVIYYGLLTAGIPANEAAHVAVTTSLAAIVPTAIVSSITHWRAGNTDFAFLRDWGPGIAILHQSAGSGGINLSIWVSIAPTQAAAWCGARFAQRIAAEQLSRVFAAALAATGLLMLHSSLGWP